MQALSQREVLLERRHFEQVQSTLWDKLTLAQKFAASSLNQFGYQLLYIRNSRLGSVAILQCDGNTATISGDGEIDTSPNVAIRN